jgi:3-oxoacyl-[acyl-carrier protein] reductase
MLCSAPITFKGLRTAGLLYWLPIEAVTEEQFHRMFNINVLGALLTTQAAVKHLGEGSSIINIGSLASRITLPNSVAYSGTKGALDAITGVLPRELGPRKIRDNSINPGAQETSEVTYCLEPRRGHPVLKLCAEP